MSTAPTGVKFRTSINGLPLVKLSRVKRFIPHAHQVGFSLNTKRLLSGLSDTSELSRPHPALLNAICLWSVALSRTSGNGVQTDIQTQEHHFLDGVVANSYDLFDSTDPFKRVQAIQTEILLAQYFFCCGHPLPGWRHANGAVSFAVMSKLHRIRSSESPSPNISLSAISGPLSTGSPFDLAEPRDMIEEGERINVFWSVFNVDRCWMVATRMPTGLESVDLANQTDTPWPLEAEDYEKVSPVSVGYSNVLRVESRCVRLLLDLIGLCDASWKDKGHNHQTMNPQFPHFVRRHRPYFTNQLDFQLCGKRVSNIRL